MTTTYKTKPTIELLDLFQAYGAATAGFDSVLNRPRTTVAAAELIADAIRAFFNGLAIVFRNPTVLLVMLAAMGYGYFNGYGTSKAEVAKLTAEVAQLRKVKRCAAPAVRTKSPPSMWDSIFN